MHTKIIDPRRDGRFVFANRGSSQKTVSYLGHDARDRNEPVRFFDALRNDVMSEEISPVIDKNAKGLRKKQETFYSLVLSPSQAELAHIGNSPSRFRDYTRAVMENYAKNFRLKDRKRLEPSELVWYAIIHQDRKEKEGERIGTSKKGHQAHVHVIVSAQDKSRQYRLNPKGWKSRFVFKEWQVQNGKTFQRLFDYGESTTSEKLTAPMSQTNQLRHRERIRQRVAYLNDYFVGSKKIDVDRALAIGQSQQYGKGFFFRLHHLTQRYQQGKLVNNPYQMLATGKDEPFHLPEYTLLKLGKQSQPMGEEAEESLERKRKKKQTQSQIER